MSEQLQCAGTGCFTDAPFDSHNQLCDGEGTIISTLQMRKQSQGV